MADELEGAPAPDDSPIDLGSLTPQTPTTAAPEAPAPEQVEDGSTETPTYTVKVGGDEFQVSLEEALNGYQRQEDYTRKTQDLAAKSEQLSHAEQLWQAIEDNPQHTITAIAEAYGFKLTPAQVAAAEQAREPDEEDLDPTEQRLAQVEKFAEEARFERLQAQVDRELQGIHSTYNVQFDDDELLQFAVDRRIGNLDDAFKAFAFERMTTVAKDKRIQQMKATAPPIAGGHGVAAGVVSPEPGRGQSMSIEEAFAAAEAQHSS